MIYPRGKAAHKKKKRQANKQISRRRKQTNDDVWVIPLMKMEGEGRMDMTK